MKAAGGKADEARNEHRHHGAALHVSHADPRLDEGVLEGEAAAEEERHEVVPPEVSDVASLLGQLALAVDAVARHVGAKICTGHCAGWVGVARWRDLSARQWYRAILRGARQLSARQRTSLLAWYSAPWPAR